MTATRLVSVEALAALAAQAYKAGLADEVDNWNASADELASIGLAFAEPAFAALLADAGSILGAWEVIEREYPPATVARLRAALPAAPAEAGLRAALLRAVEEVGNAWYDEDGTVIWREELWDRLVILRREYGTIEEAELAALAAQEGAGE